MCVTESTVPPCQAGPKSSFLFTDLTRPHEPLAAEQEGARPHSCLGFPGTLPRTPPGFPMATPGPLQVLRWKQQLGLGRPLATTSVKPLESMLKPN